MSNIFNDDIYKTNILTELDLFSNLDELELSKLFLKIYIRKYLHVLNKIQIRSKFINKMSKAKDAAKEHLEEQSELSRKWHTYNTLNNKPHNSAGPFFMSPWARKQCDNNLDNEILPAYCNAINDSIMKAALENKIGAENIFYMLSILSILYNKYNGEELSQELNNIYRKVQIYKEKIIRGEPIDNKEFMKTSAKITEMFAKKSSDTQLDTQR